MVDKKHKNCEIYVCGENGVLNIEDKKIMKSLKKIFEQSHDLTKIGIESSNAFATILKGFKENKIIIKIPRKTNGSVDSVKYEYVVGCHIKNSLCSCMPNFMKIYGYINKNDNEYLIIQRVLPGLSFREHFCGDIAQTFTPVNKSLILQVLCALQMAQNKIKFTHYDLHLGNVLIKDEKELKDIVYVYTDKHDRKHTIKIPIIDNKIAVIIDYGRSHTNKASKYLRRKKEIYKNYAFLNKKHNTDIRCFDSKVDARRFCNILKKYIKELDFLDLNFISEPHDIIKQFIHHY